MILQKLKVTGNIIVNKKIKKISNYESFDDWVTAVIRQEPDGVDEYMQIAFEEFIKDGDEKALLITLRQVAKAKGGFQKLADKTGIKRESLYRSLSDHGNPRFNTFSAILNALGYGLYLKPIHHHH
jgi:probable addiction module antidote protein